MKKLIIIIIVAVALGGLYVWMKDSNTPKADSTATTVGAGYHPDPSNATFTIEGDEVTLSNGKAETADPTGATTETELLDQRAYGDLNGDGKEDVAVFLSQSGGGSGTFIYVAAYVSGPVGYKGTEAVFLGDRVNPTSISISNDVVTVTYLDRKDGEPMSAEPTVPVTKHFAYQNGTFAEK